MDDWNDQFDPQWYYWAWLIGDYDKAIRDDDDDVILDVLGQALLFLNHFLVDWWMWNFSELCLSHSAFRRRNIALRRSRLRGH